MRPRPVYRRELLAGTRRRSDAAHVTDGSPCWCDPDVYQYGEVFHYVHNDTILVH